jgi:hypothetical protein
MAGPGGYFWLVLILVGTLSLLCLGVDGSINAKEYKVPDGVVRYKPIRKTLYQGVKTEEFLALCSRKNNAQPEIYDPFCAGWTEKEMIDLENAQKRISLFEKTLESYYVFPIQSVLIFFMLLMGSYLIVKKHFTFWAFVAFFRNDLQFKDPTFGLSYRVYRSMKMELIETETTVHTTVRPRSIQHI